MEWNDSDSAKVVLEWAEGRQIMAVRAVAELRATEVGRKAMEEYWDKQNPMDGIGGFVTNPYQEKLKRIEYNKGFEEDVVKWNKTLAFVRDRICEMVE